MSYNGFWTYVSVSHGDMFGGWFFFEQQQLRHVVMMNNFQSLFDFIVQIVVTARASDVIERNALRVHETEPKLNHQKCDLFGKYIVYY